MSIRDWGIGMTKEDLIKNLENYSKIWKFRCHRPLQNLEKKKTFSVANASPVMSSKCKSK